MSVQRRQINNKDDIEKCRSWNPKGRPVGSKDTKPRTANMALINKYANEGLLPHEILLLIARGKAMPMGYDENGDPLKDDDGKILYWHPNMDERLDAAKSGAPYFAPKLSAIEVMKGMTDDTLLELIVGTAAACGLEFTAGGISASPSFAGPGEVDACRETSPGVFESIQE